MKNEAQKILETNIIDLLGLQNLAEQQKAELLARMTEVVQDRISDRVVESFSADQRSAFDALIDRGAPEAEMNAFFQKNVPEYGQIAAEEILRFKSQMVGDVATVRKIAVGNSAAA